LSFRLSFLRISKEDSRTSDFGRCRTFTLRTLAGPKGQALYHLRSPEQKDTGCIHSPEGSSHKRDSSHKNAGDSSHKFEELQPEDLARLKALAGPAIGARLRPEETRRIVLELCDGRYLTASDLGKLLNRSSNN